MFFTLKILGGNALPPKDFLICNFFLTKKFLLHIKNRQLNLRFKIKNLKERVGETDTFFMLFFLTSIKSFLFQGNSYCSQKIFSKSRTHQFLGSPNNEA